MAAYWEKDGSRFLYSNSGSAIVAGDVVTVVSGNSGFIGVAVTAIAATTGTGEVEIKGRYNMAKATGEAFTAGQRLYWNGTGLTGASTGNTAAGRAVIAAASADTTAS